MEHPRVTHASADFCPYVGLRPFTVAEQPFFFGRRSETRIVAANLFATPLTVFYGPSAVGKSSVLQAGVIPQLRREPRTAVLYFRDWQHDDYLDRMKAECTRAIALARGTPIDIDASLSLDQWIEAALEQFRGQLHILLDQFEEYLLYHPDTSPTAFDGDLAAAINRRDIGARFLIGLREDGLAKLDRFRKRIPNLLGNALRLRRLSLAAAREAVEGPLRVYNERLTTSESDAQAPPRDRPVDIEPDLVDAILEQVRADHVSTGASDGEGSVKSAQSAEEVETAYLQLVMERLWRERTAANGRLVIQRAALERLGGAKAIAKSHFDEHLVRLAAETPHLNDMVCDLFTHLVTPTGSKISQKEGDLVALTNVPADEVRWFLRELVAARLLRVTDPPERYEIFHDALAKPFLDARNAIVVKRAGEAREAELKRVQAIADAQQARADAEALRVAEQRAATRRFKRLAFGAIALALAAVASALFAVWSRNEALNARRAAEESRAEAQRAEAEIAAITARTSTLANEQQARIGDLTTQLAQSKTLTAKEREDLLQQTADSKAELAKLNTQLAQVQRSTPDKSDKGPALRTDLEEARRQSAAALKDLDAARGQIAALEAKVRTSQADLATLTTERDDLRESANKTSSALKTAQGEIERLRTEIADLRQKLAAARSVDPGGGGTVTPKNDTPSRPEKPEVPAGDYRSAYARGIRAFDLRQWADAAKMFAAAAEQKGDANEQIRIFGMRGEPYLPNYYLGQAYRELGRCDDALRAWAQSEKDGIVQRNADEYKRLLQGRAACQPKD
jgi:Novel STAND NTPase 1